MKEEYHSWLTRVNHPYAEFIPHAAWLLNQAHLPHAPANLCWVASALLALRWHFGPSVSEVALRAIEEEMRARGKRPEQARPLAECLQSMVYYLEGNVEGHV